MNTILLPLDGSALAEQALPYVRKLAPLLGARVRLRSVIADERYDRLVAEGIAAAYGVIDPLTTQRERGQQTLATLRQHAEGYRAAQAMRLRSQGVEIECDVRCGPAAEVSVEAAESADVSL